MARDVLGPAPINDLAGTISVACNTAMLAMLVKHVPVSLLL